MPKTSPPAPATSRRGWTRSASRQSPEVSDIPPRRWLTLALAGALTSCAGGARLAELEHALAAQDSATAALGDWCRARAIADPAAITAERIASDMPRSPDTRTILVVRGDERVAYRNVRLMCGAATLSVARNWYVPARLPPEMRRRLETSDTPFGKVIAPLRFTRERRASRRGRAAGCPAGTVLSHRALLRLPDGRPVSYLVECYTRANLVSGGGAPAAVRPPS